MSNTVFHVATDMSSHFYEILASNLSERHKFYHIRRRGDVRRAASDKIIEISSGSLIQAYLKFYLTALQSNPTIVVHGLFPYVIINSLLLNNLSCHYVVRSSDIHFLQRHNHLKTILRKLVKKKKLIYKCHAIFNDLNEELLYDFPAPEKLYFNHVNEVFLSGKSWRPISKVTAEPYSILCVANLNPNKNILQVVEYANFLVENGIHKSVSVTIVGAEDCPGYIEKLMKVKGPFVEINYQSKRRTAEEMKNLYLSCDICIVPSQYETFGLVFAEAASMGVPVVGLKHHGLWNTPPFAQCIAFSSGCESVALHEACCRAELLTNSGFIRSSIAENIYTTKLWEKIDANNFN